MAHLTVKNFGPISWISIPLNRIMVFMGPQSSGKSTIAKIISFCRWLEKECVFHQDVEFVDARYVHTHLIEFFHLEKYIHSDSEISYKSDVLEFNMCAGTIDGEELVNVTISALPSLDNARLSKNIYIPSERNIIGIPRYTTIKLPEDYLNSFITDWLEIQEKFTGTAPVRLDGFNGEFYYDENLGRGLVKMSDVKDLLEMSEVSSGLQSVVPLLTVAEYMMRWIFINRVENEIQKKQDLDNRIINKMQSMSRLPESIRVASVETKRAALKNIKKYASEEDVPDSHKDLFSYYDRLSYPHISNVVVEEPEQNIFPESQVNIVYHLLSSIDLTRSSLVLTTHSPFILYAINNCLLGYKVRNVAAEIGDGDLLGFEESWTDPGQVSVYEIDNGCLRGINGAINTTIQDSKGLIRRNYFDATMNGVMADFTNLLGLLD